MLAFMSDCNWLAPNLVQLASETLATDPTLQALGSTSDPVYAVSVLVWFEKFHSIYEILTESDLQAREAPFDYLSEGGFVSAKRLECSLSNVPHQSVR